MATSSEDLFSLTSGPPLLLSAAGNALLNEKEGYEEKELAECLQRLKLMCETRIIAQQMLLKKLKTASDAEVIQILTRTLSLRILKLDLFSNIQDKDRPDFYRQFLTERIAEHYIGKYQFIIEKIQKLDSLEDIDQIFILLKLTSTLRPGMSKTHVENNETKIIAMLASLLKPHISSTLNWFLDNGGLTIQPEKDRIDITTNKIASWLNRIGKIYEQNLVLYYGSIRENSVSIVYPIAAFEAGWNKIVNVLHSAKCKYEREIGKHHALEASAETPRFKLGINWTVMINNLVRSHKLALEVLKQLSSENQILKKYFDDRLEIKNRLKRIIETYNQETGMKINKLAVEIEDLLKRISFEGGFVFFIVEDVQQILNENKENHQLFQNSVSRTKTLLQEYRGQSQDREILEKALKISEDHFEFLNTEIPRKLLEARNQIRKVWQGISPSLEQYPVASAAGVSEKVGPVVKKRTKKKMDSLSRKEDVVQTEISETMDDLPKTDTRSIRIINSQLHQLSENELKLREIAAEKYADLSKNSLELLKSLYQEKFGHSDLERLEKSLNRDGIKTSIKFVSSHFTLDIQGHWAITPHVEVNEMDISQTSAAGTTVAVTGKACKVHNKNLKKRKNNRYYSEDILATLQALFERFGFTEKLVNEKLLAIATASDISPTSASASVASRSTGP